MIPVAVVIREDTGEIRARSGPDPKHLAEVYCDRTRDIRTFSNDTLVEISTKEFHHFDGAIFDKDCYGNAQYEVSVKFEVTAKGDRIARFYYVSKVSSKGHPDDPYCLTVFNGKKHLVRVGRMKEKPGKMQSRR